MEKLINCLCKDFCRCV